MSHRSMGYSTTSITELNPLHGHSQGGNFVGDEQESDKSQRLEEKSSWLKGPELADIMKVATIE